MIVAALQALINIGIRVVLIEVGVSFLTYLRLGKYHSSYCSAYCHPKLEPS